VSQPYARWGIAGSYSDAFGARRRIQVRVQRAVRDAMGVAQEEEPPDVEPVVLARPGMALQRPATVVLEDRTDLGRLDRLPDDLPFGYHRLLADDGPERLAIVAPPRCHVPPRLRAWGWSVQLYATRSAASWGIGDYADLDRLARWSARLGAGALAVSPTWAPNPGTDDPEPSPYYPSTRRFRNTLALRIDEVPGAAELPTDLRRAGRELNAGPGIDRAAALRHRRVALDWLWEHRVAGVDAAAFQRFRSEQGAGLEAWATFSALAERHGPRWRAWPEEYRDPGSPAVRRFAEAHPDRLAFHAWLQWQLDEQLRSAAAHLRLINDLPVSVDPQGFDAWSWQGIVSAGATVGAPPDRFNTLGQDWGTPPFVPHRLRAAGYRPFIDTVRAALRHAGGLRMDHVLALFRMWWIPTGCGPADGAYVRYRSDELLAILAIETHRAGALVVGEDLGTVPRGVRTKLSRRHVLSTKVLYFERRPPRSWPRLALATVTTHDLPTVAGTWSGADLDDQAAAGLEPDRGGLAELRGRLEASAPEAATERDAIVAAHAAIAASPCVLALATLDDALAVPLRPNIPGTTSDQRPNWSLPLPKRLDEIEADPLVARVVDAMRR
jgi:4-alpha-glucanotransferase